MVFLEFTEIPWILENLLASDTHVSVSGQQLVSSHQLESLLQCTQSASSHDLS
jgi:hypothetical protein